MRKLSRLLCLMLACSLMAGIFIGCGKDRQDNSTFHPDACALKKPSIII